MQKKINIDGFISGFMEKSSQNPFETIGNFLGFNKDTSGLNPSGIKNITSQNVNPNELALQLNAGTKTQKPPGMLTNLLTNELQEVLKTPEASDAVQGFLDKQYESIKQKAPEYLRKMFEDPNMSKAVDEIVQKRLESLTSGEGFNKMMGTLMGKVTPYAIGLGGLAMAPMLISGLFGGGNNYGMPGFRRTNRSRNPKYYQYENY